MELITKNDANCKEFANRKKSGRYKLVFIHICRASSSWAIAATTFAGFHSAGGLFQVSMIGGIPLALEHSVGLQARGVNRGGHPLTALPGHGNRKSGSS